MTVLVGLRCTDGVVIGADSSATFGPNMMMKTIEQAVQKVFVIEDRYIMAGTGEIGLCQRFADAIQQAHDKKELRGSRFEIGKALCNAARNDFASTGVLMNLFGGLVAYPVEREACLCEFAVKDLQPEWKEGKMWFSSMGSGQTITDPFLGLIRRVFFPDSAPTVTEGIFVTMWALQHAIDLNPGGINGPPQIATLRNTDGKTSAMLLDDAELQEHIANVEGAEKHLAKYRDILRGTLSPDVPSVAERLPVAPADESIDGI
jgi:hypothetical protein